MLKYPCQSDPNANAFPSDSRTVIPASQRVSYTCSAYSFPVNLSMPCSEYQHCNVGVHKHKLVAGNAAIDAQVDALGDEGSKGTGKSP